MGTPGLLPKTGQQGALAPPVQRATWNEPPSTVVIVSFLRFHDLGLIDGSKSILFCKGRRRENQWCTAP